MTINRHLGSFHLYGRKVGSFYVLSFYRYGVSIWQLQFRRKGEKSIFKSKRGTSTK